MGKGWIMLYRQIQETAIWTTNEPFDQRSAWIDLIMMANIKTKESTYRKTAFKIKRGQVCTSIRKLSERWHWSIGKTRRFLKLLEDLNMIRHEKRHTGGTLLTIVKYNDFQNLRHSNEHTNEHTNGYSNGHTSGTLLNKGNNAKTIEEGQAANSVEQAAAQEEEEYVGMTDEEWEALGEDI